MNVNFLNHDEVSRFFGLFSSYQQYPEPKTKLYLSYYFSLLGKESEKRFLAPNFTFQQILEERQKMGSGGAQSRSGNVSPDNVSFLDGLITKERRFIILSIPLYTIS